MLLIWLLIALAAWVPITWRIVNKRRCYGRRPEISRANAIASLPVYALGFSWPIPAILLVAL